MLQLPPWPTALSADIDPATSTPARADDVDPAGRRAASVVALVAVAGFALARLIDLVILQRELTEHPGHSLSGYLTAWDGGWYQLIAAQGYPSELVRAHSGYLVRNALAFYPAYPGLVRGLQDVTGLSFAVAGVMLNLVLGGAAAAMIALVLRPRLGGAAAATGSVFWSFLPVSPVLMMTYTEALFSLELVAFCWLLGRRRYVGLALLLPLAGLSRGALLPLAPVLLVHLVLRWREAGASVDGRNPDSQGQDGRNPDGQGQDGGNPDGQGQDGRNPDGQGQDGRDQDGRDQDGRAPDARAARLRVTAVVGGLLVMLVASFALWPAWVAYRTGRRDAYLLIQQAWIRDRGTYGSWAQAVDQLAHGRFGTAGHGLIAAVGLILLLLALLALFTPLSAELKVIAPSYLLFFVLATPAWSSFYRYMLPVFTLAAVPALVVRVRWWPVRVVAVAVVLTGFVVGQQWWIANFVVPFPHHGLTP